MSSINFDNPWLLLITLPILLVLLVPFFFTVRKDNRNVHNVVSCVLHVLIAVCIAFAAAGTSVQSILRETDVYVVADVSYSTNEKLETIDGHIARLKKNLPRNSNLGVVCFGATDSQTVLTPLGGELKSVREAVTADNGAVRVDDTSTDIASALQYARKIFKSGVVKRVVLITDAKQSNESDTGALKRAVDTLHEARVFVDAIYLDSNLSKGAQEVQISSVQFLDEVYQDSEATAKIIVQSGTATNTHLHISRNFEKNGEHIEEVVAESLYKEIKEGTNSLEFSLDTATEGVFTYTVKLTDTDADRSGLNDTYTFTQKVASQPTTLFLTDADADFVRAQELYGANEVYYYGVSNPPEGASVAVLNVARANYVPSTVTELCAYDEIVLSDFDLEEISNLPTFVENLEITVSHLGKSLVVMGNLGDSVGLLADMLPVDYGSPIREEETYVIVMDVSYSMQVSGRETLLKASAKQLIDEIVQKNPKNRIAIVKYAQDAKVVLSASSAVSGGDIKDVGDIKKAIDNVTFDYGTGVAQGLEFAETQIPDNAKSHVYILTDGEQSYEGANERGALAALKNKGAKVYAAVMNSSATNEEKVARFVGEGNCKTIKNLSGVTNLLGRPAGEDGEGDELETSPKGYYFAKQKQFLDEVLDGIPEQTFRPFNEGGSHAMIRQYMSSIAKANATVVLATDYVVPDMGAVEVPLYAYRKYGSGKTSAFLSNFEWVSEYWDSIRLEDGEKLTNRFFKNVFKSNTPKERVHVPYTVSMERQAGVATVEVRPTNKKSDVRVDITLVAPDGTKTELLNVTPQNNVYSCTFTLPNVGEYGVDIAYTYKDTAYTVLKSVYLSYLPEYDRFTAFDASPLYRMLSEHGTVSEDGNLKLENDEREVGIWTVDLTPTLLIIAVVLFVVDIIVRKVKWADIQGFFRRVKKGGRL